MGDLSYSSMVENDPKSGGWLLGPLDRLRLKPQLDSQAHLWPRTERKALSMLLQAIKGRFEVRSSARGNSRRTRFSSACSAAINLVARWSKLSCFKPSRIASAGKTVREVLNWI